jgi:hypothetical protein
VLAMDSYLFGAIPGAAAATPQAAALAA